MWLSDKANKEIDAEMEFHQKELERLKKEDDARWENATPEEIKAELERLRKEQMFMYKPGPIPGPEPEPRPIPGLEPDEHALMLEEETRGCAVLDNGASTSVMASSTKATENLHMERMRQKRTKHANSVWFG